jgi:hypothetical protein
MMEDSEVVRELRRSLQESYLKDRDNLIRCMTGQVQDIQEVIDAMVRHDEYLPSFMPPDDHGGEDLLLRLHHAADVLDSIRRMKESTWDNGAVL